MAKRTWLWVVLGVITILMVGCVAMVGTGVYLVTRQMQVTPADEVSAEDQFERIRERFSGAAPLIVVPEDGRPSIEDFEKRAAEYAGPPPKSLHVLAFDPGEDKLVRFSLPFWFLRLAPSGRTSFRLDEFNLERIRLDPADFERVGPALILDHTERGARVMLWTE